jgi:hypothetical protein
MKKNIIRIVSIVLTLAMLATPAFAIIAPNDALPMEKSVDEIYQELDIINIKKQHLELCEETEDELEMMEVSLLAQLDEKGIVKMSNSEFMLLTGNGIEISPNFGEIGAAYYDFYVYEPTPITYQGRSLYYVVVDVVPIDSNAIMWIESSETVLEEVGTSYYSFRNKAFTTSPSSGTDTVDYIFPNLTDHDFPTDYVLSYNAYVRTRYIFLGYDDSNFYYDYNVAHVSTAIVVNEAHKIDTVGDGPSEWMSRVAYAPYYDVNDALDYFLPRYFNGNQFDMFYYFDFTYKYGSRVLYDGPIRAPYSYPTLY